MSSTERVEYQLLRLRLVLMAMLAGLVFLGSMLWRVQVRHASRYESTEYRQSIRRVRLPARRGPIFDRRGMCLAENRPSYCIAVFVEELRRPGSWTNTVNRIDEVVRELEAVLQVERETTREDIAWHIKRRRPLPFLAWRDVSPQTLARWAEHSARFPGVDVYVEPTRHYPNGAVGAHVLGYVGRLDDEDVDDGAPYHFYLPEIEGKRGIERSLNSALAGRAGGRLIRVDASGFKHDETGELEPQSGHTVTLTIDLRIQSLLESLLTNQVGAAVVVDPRNGEVLALASAPGFDPVELRTVTGWKKLRSDPAKPLYNRAVSGAYAPGSTFKPVVAAAALEAGRVTPQTTYFCPGYFAVGGVRFHCWRRSGHQRLAMRKAIEQSCNAFFCELGVHCGFERIHEVAHALRFGAATGIRLENESSGLLPDSAWKRKHFGDDWRTGDTCNISIGQGALLATPLQMALFAATLANYGTIYQPRLVRAIQAPDGTARRFHEGVVAGRVQWQRETFEVIRDGMYDVVNAPSGTGKRAWTAAVAVAGKTGTAEYGPRSARRKYAWMIAFAPFERPEVAVALVLEDAVSGGRDAAPRVHDLMEAIFGPGRERDA